MNIIWKEYSTVIVFHPMLADSPYYAMNDLLTIMINEMKMHS